MQIFHFSTLFLSYVYIPDFRVHSLCSYITQQVASIDASMYTVSSSNSNTDTQLIRLFIPPKNIQSLTAKSMAANLYLGRQKS